MYDRLFEGIDDSEGSRALKAECGLRKFNPGQFLKANNELLLRFIT